MWRRFLAGGAILISVAACLGVSVTGNAAFPPIDPTTFMAERGQMAFALSEPIATCVARHDTGNPAFHGCIDWHSAVHGTWALTAYGWATGDQRYQPLVDSILRPELLVEERRHLAADPNFEMPYGRAWFLRLAVDYRRTHDDGRLDGMADDFASSLMAHYARVTPAPTSIAYDSASWALINLHDYGVSRGDARILDFVKRQVEANFITDGPCPLQTAEVATGEFMAVCTNWAWLVGKVEPRATFLPWLARFMPPELALDPVVIPATVHQTALDFSRAAGLWGLYKLTGEARFRDAYFRHFNQTYAQPALWKGRYDTVAHWVAQFGMFALMVTYYDQP